MDYQLAIHKSALDEWGYELLYYTTNCSKLRQVTINFEKEGCSSHIICVAHIDILYQFYESLLSKKSIHIILYNNRKTAKESVMLSLCFDKHIFSWTLHQWNDDEEAPNKEKIYIKETVTITNKSYKHLCHIFEQLLSEP